MKDDYESGRCYACKEDKPVRWKNLYTTGSEGTWLCITCEMKVIDMLRDLSTKATHDKIEHIKDAKIKKNLRDYRHRQATHASWWIN